MNYLAQKAGVAALTDDHYIENTHKWIFKEKLNVADRLKKINNLKVFETKVNFVLIKFQTEQIAFKIMDKLKLNRILVRSCANFRGLDGSYIRMAIRHHNDNDKVIDLIENMLEEN